LVSLGKPQKFEIILIIKIMTKKAKKIANDDKKYFLDTIRYEMLF